MPPAIFSKDSQMSTVTCTVNMYFIICIHHKQKKYCKTVYTLSSPSYLLLNYFHFICCYLIIFHKQLNKVTNNMNISMLVFRTRMIIITIIHAIVMCTYIRYSEYCIEIVSKLI